MRNQDDGSQYMGKGGNVTSVGWQVALYYPIHVSSRSCVIYPYSFLYFTLLYCRVYIDRVK